MRHHLPVQSASPRDTRGRILRDLRISVTDRCNFRCTYCMPRAVYNSSFRFLPRAEILSFEEIERLAKIFVSMGVRKIRITGGEPLLRRDLPKLIARLSRLDVDLALTTNGTQLAEMSKDLVAAGLKRVTVSLDSLDQDQFQKITDSTATVQSVLDGIEAAHTAGLRPVKVNAVIRQGSNDDSVLALAEHFRGTPHILRFIEFMDVGATNDWRAPEVLSARTMIDQIHKAYPIEPVEAEYPEEVAKRWRYSDGQGELGFITSISQPFCGDCSRARLSAEGKLYTCLFASEGKSLLEPLRGGATDDDLLRLLGGIWSRRDDHYSEIRSQQSQRTERVEMSHIGG